MINTVKILSKKKKEKSMSGKEIITTDQGEKKYKQIKI